jgi:hypothetical protein
MLPSGTAADPPQQTRKATTVAVDHQGWHKLTTRGVTKATMRAAEPDDSATALILVRVPELTRNSDIQLNERVSLQRRPNAVNVMHRILSPSGPSMAKSPGDHTPSGGFVLRRTAHDC